MLKRLLSSLAAITIALIMPLAGAQGANQGQGLEISPPLSEVKADPGQTVTVKVKIRNVTGQTLEVHSDVNDFTAAGEDGRPKLLLEKGAKSPYSLKNWISTIDTVTLRSQEQKPVTITLNVPQAASPGGHYGVVRFTGTPPGFDETGVSLSASIGNLLLVRVSGDIQEKAQIEELYVQNLKGQRRGFFEYGPLNLETRVKNTGNVHLQPKGTIRITNLFGKETATLNLNAENGNVLPASTRRFENLLNKKLLFGRYKFAVDMTYGTNSTIVSASTTFWVIPYKLIAIAIAVIVLVIFGVKRYNKYIVKKAKK